MPRCRLLQSSSILIPGDTVWRRCKAGRLAILNDAAAYFAALREALLLATRQVYIIGWDIHSLTRFVGPSGQADDGYPAELGAFLKALLNAKPGLRINILSWNFPALYAAEREWNSAAKFTSEASDRLCFCFDSSLPLGSAQHQKIVVIDGVLAFVGGLDLTIRRWDTSAHDAHHPLRIDPDGKPYPPFHDVQCMLDGEAAASLTEVVENRWRAAGCTVETSAAVTGERWPASVPVQSRGMTVGVARTEIATASEAGVNEVARLFEASINAADRFIYIENQFTSATDIARLLAQRMLDVPQLHVLIVTPKMHSSWFELQAMQSGRGGFIAQFVAADVMDRICFLYPSTRDGEQAAAVMVHSKVMIVDDRILRVGSANLNNRSMGADTECDLAFEATSEAHRKYITRLRCQLIGHFCGVDERDIASNDADLFGFLERLAERGGAKSLQPIDSGSDGRQHGNCRAACRRPQRTPSPRPRRQSHVDSKNHFGRIRVGRGARRPRFGLAVHIVARFYRHRLRLLGHFATRMVAIRAAARDCRIRPRRVGGVSGAGLDRRHGRGIGAVDGFLQRRHRRAAQRVHAVFDRPRAGSCAFAAAAWAPRGAGSEPHHRQGGRGGRHDPDGADRPVLDRERGGGRQQT